MNKWFRHKIHQNAIAKLQEMSHCYRLVFYWIVKDELEQREHEEVTKMFYVDKREAINVLFKLDYLEDV